MNQSTMRATALLIISIALIAAGYFYQNHQAALSSVELASATTTAPQFTTADVQGGGTTQIIPITTGSDIKAPDYTRKLTFTAKLTANEKERLQKSYAEVQAVLKRDSLSFNEWIFMGNINHIAGNEALAKEYWEYASAMWPTNVASFNNLGDLYMNYLKDYPKAEKNWLQAVKNKPDDTNPYRNLFTLYTETSYKPTNTAAEEILKKAIAANPRAVDMQYMLAVHYKKLGRIEESKAMYQAAIDNATRQGQTQLASQIKADLSAVK